MIRPKDIAIDIDGVCLDLMTPWLSLYNREYDDCLTLLDLTDWNVHQFTKPECGTYMYDFIRMPEAYDNVRPIPDALIAINALRAEGHRVYFVTSSPWQTFGPKLECMARHGFIELKRGSCRDVVCASDKDLVRGDILIDDYYENVKNRPLGFLFTQPWNTRHTQFIWRCNGWRDVIEQLNFLSITEKTPQEIFT